MIGAKIITLLKLIEVLVKNTTHMNYEIITVGCNNRIVYRNKKIS